MAVLTACNNHTTKEKAIEDHSTAEKHIHCYAFISGRDTISMTLNIKDKLVDGKLTYNFYEKDLNEGTIAGTMKGDTLFAIYTFMSEGLESKREVAFLKKGQDFSEGYGEAIEKNEEMVFKNRNTITFDNKSILKHIDCPK